MRAHRFILVTIISILALEIVSAVSIGISPGRVNFDELLDGGYAERTITISTNTEEILLGHFTVSGTIEEWVRFEPNVDQFNVSSNAPYKLTIIVEPPTDMPSGNYSGSIDFITDGIGTIGGRAGGVVKAAVTLLMNAEVTRDQIIDCRAGAFRFADTEENFPLEFSTTIINDGNVRLNPTLTIDIWDQLQENLLLSEEIVGDVVLPTTQQRIDRKLEHTLQIGQYWVEFGAEECGTDELLTFSIVEEGAIVDQGFLSGIVSKPDASVGETVEFIAKFENKGPRSVSAKFKGNIRLDDTIVKVIDTDEILVDTGGNTDFNIFFTPQEPGRYSLSGRVIYNKKMTYEKGSILNVDVSEEQESTFSIIPLLIYLAIIITIVFIFRKIIRERKKNKF